MKKNFTPDKLGSYFRAEAKTLIFVTISGLICNLGILAGPLLEGKLTQCLLGIFTKQDEFRHMLVLSLIYVGTIGIVQGARYFKRFYVRRFANNTNRTMKQVLYHSLVYKRKSELQKETEGALLTKAISDVNDCVEGMRKFTTEIFDTGVVMLGYIGLMFFYDDKIAWLSLSFLPIAFLVAQKMKSMIQRYGIAYKESASRLSQDTMDRVNNSLTYRVYGCEEERSHAYEKHLKEHEKTAIRSQVLGSAMQPIYHIIAMFGVVFILYYGAKKVLSNVWDIAIFTAYLSCYGKLSVRVSKIGVLFNAVQKAEVSWKRILPFMVCRENIKETEAESDIPFVEAKDLAVPSLFQGLSFRIGKGEILGVTGPVACGKSTFGRIFIQEESYEGMLSFGGRKEVLPGVVGYLGHTTELFSDTIENNILLGDKGDVWKYLRAVELDEEVQHMKDGVHTVIGTGGIRLSGGQKQRVVLARMLAHRKPVLLLDDPFSALDQKTERRIYHNLRCLCKDSVLILISHRLTLFPLFEQVIFMDNQTVKTGTHATLMKTCPLYRELYERQQTGEKES